MSEAKTNDQSPSTADQSSNDEGPSLAKSFHNLFKKFRGPAVEHVDENGIPVLVFSANAEPAPAPAVDEPAPAVDEPAPIQEAPKETPSSPFKMPKSIRKQKPESKPREPPSTGSSTAFGNPSYTGAAPFMFPPMGMMMMAPSSCATLDTVAQQLDSLAQCVSWLSQRVIDNQHLHEESTRLKELIKNLEFQVKQSENWANDIAVLRQDLEKKYKVAPKSKHASLPVSVTKAVNRSGLKPGTISSESESTKDKEDDEQSAEDGEGDSKKPEEDQDDEEGPKIPDIKPDNHIMKTKIIDMDRKTEIPSSIWDQGLVCGITRLSLQQCKLAEVPKQVFTLRCTLKELELGQNIIKEVPGAIGKMVKLTKLTLNNNQISALPTEMGKLANLEELTLSHNKFTEVPEPIYELKALCSLILANNQISNAEGKKFVPMKALVTLSFENNNLSKLSNELGLIPNLKTIMVGGNSFRIPNRTLVAKGSAAVLEYLKNRCPE